MAEQRKTLPEACAPLFLFLSTFWRNSATSKASVPELKQSIKDEFDRLRDVCQRDPRLEPLFERTHYALVAAADQIVLSSSWSQRAAWSTQSLEKDVFRKMEGGKRFFRLVEEVLEDSSRDAAELAEVLFTCLALGFRGELIGEKRELERCRRQLFAKARLEGALGERLTPEAYGRNAAPRPMTLPTTNALRLVAVCVGSLVFLWLVWTVSEYTSNKTAIEKARLHTPKLRDGSGD